MEYSARYIGIDSHNVFNQGLGTHEFLYGPNSNPSPN